MWTERARRGVLIALLTLSAGSPLAGPRSLDVGLDAATASQWVMGVDRLQIAERFGDVVKTLPPLQFQLTLRDDQVVPQGHPIIQTAHPLWDVILGDGEWAQQGGRITVRMPLTLLEKDANCVHYGVLHWQYAVDETETHGRLVIASQTCEYFKFAADYPLRVTIASAAASPTRSMPHQPHFPQRGMDQLALDTGIDGAALAPPAGVSPAHLTVAGLLIDGKHYRSDCATPAGTYPYCAQIPLPSFSLAKGLVAGVALMGMERRFPGTKGRPIGEWLPACAPGWNAINIGQALDMQTGRYADPGYFVDEDAAIASPLFVAATHHDKLAYACDAYPRRTAPGRRWVYHSADTYVALSAMQALYRARTDARHDIYRDFLHGTLWRELPLSPLAGFTRRTRDADQQAYGGWGLVMPADDYLQLAQWLMREALAPQQLDPDLVKHSLLPQGKRPGVATDDATLRYHNGFWLLNVGPHLGCAASRWIPFLSGHGGITLAWLGPDTVYYYVSDNNEFLWLSAVRALHAQRPLCR